MSELEDKFAEIVRKVLREELASITGDRPEELLDAEDVAAILKVNKQKVYSLARQHEIEPIMLSKRDMRWAPEVIREFQLRKGIKAA